MTDPCDLFSFPESQSTTEPEPGHVNTEPNCNSSDIIKEEKAKEEQPWKPEVGVTFDSLEDAETKIRDWARNIGFELRRGHSKKGGENLGLYSNSALVPVVHMYVNIYMTFD